MNDEECKAGAANDYITSVLKLVRDSLMEDGVSFEFALVTESSGGGMLFCSPSVDTEEAAEVIRQGVNKNVQQNRADLN